MLILANGDSKLGGFHTLGVCGISAGVAISRGQFNLYPKESCGFGKNWFGIALASLIARGNL